MPSDSQPGEVNSDIKWALPKHFYKGSSFLIKPYTNGKYDIENWLIDDTYATFFLNLRGVRTNLHEKLRETFSQILNRPCILESTHDSVAVWFPEIPVKSKILKTPKKHRNSFY